MNKKDNKDNLRNHRLSFFLILFIAVIVRVAALNDLKSTPYYNFLIYDEYVFHSWAAKIAAGTASIDEAHLFAPLFPYIMAAIYKLFYADIFYIRLLNIILGVAACCGIYFLTKELADKKTALLALVIGALYEPLVFYSIVPLKAILSTILFSAVVYFYLVGKRKQAPRVIFFAGLALGMLLNVRPQAGILIPAMVIMFIIGCQSHPRTKQFASNAVIAFSLGIFLAVAPFVARNYISTSTLSLTTTQAGFNFYRANKSISTDVPVNFAETLPTVQETQFRIEASRRVGRKLTREEASRYWKNETLREIGQSPGSFFKNIVYKSLLLFRQHQLMDHYSIRFMHEFMPILKLPFFSFSFVMPLGAVGLLLMALKRKQGRDLLTLFILYASTLVIFFMRTRYRLPLASILIPCSAVFLVQLHAELLDRKIKNMMLPIAFLCCFLFLTLFPISRDRDFTSYLNGHALALKTAGETGRAVVYWRLSSDAKGMYSDFANLSLADHYLRKKEYSRVEDFLGRIPETSYAVAQKYLIIGEKYLIERDLSQAAVAYRKSLYYNSGLLLPLKRLAMIYTRLNDPRKDQSYRNLKYIQSFYSN